MAIYLMPFFFAKISKERKCRVTVYFFCVVVRFWTQLFFFYHNYKWISEYDFFFLEPSQKNQQTKTPVNFLRVFKQKAIFNAHYKYLSFQAYFNLFSDFHIFKNSTHNFHKLFLIFTCAHPNGYIYNFMENTS